MILLLRKSWGAKVLPSSEIHIENAWWLRCIFLSPSSLHLRDHCCHPCRTMRGKYSWTPPMLLALPGSQEYHLSPEQEIREFDLKWNVEQNSNPWPSLRQREESISTLPGPVFTTSQDDPISSIEAPSRGDSRESPNSQSLTHSPSRQETAREFFPLSFPDSTARMPHKGEGILQTISPPSHITHTFSNFCNFQDDARGFRWNPLMIHWAMSLQYYGGKRTLDVLRGEPTTSLGSHGHLIFDPGKCGILLPAASTLRSYLHHVSPYKGTFDAAPIKAHKFMRKTIYCLEINQKKHS